MKKIAVSTLVVAAAFGWSGQAQITLNGGGVTKLEVVARDPQVNGLVNQIEDLFPASLPFDGIHEAIQGDSHSQAQYHLTQDGFSILSSGARAGILDSRANVQPTIFFSVSVDTPYNISGALSVDDPGLTGKGVELTATLTDVGTLGVLYHSDQASFGVVDESFVLGGRAGNELNGLSGSAAGILLAGHQYSLYYGTSIYASDAGDPASFVGSFEMSLGEQQVPDSGASSAGLLGLSLLGLVACGKALRSPAFSRGPHWSRFQRA